MAVHYLSDFEIQGRSGVHTGYAQALELQRLRLSGSEERRRCCLKSKRRGSIKPVDMALCLPFFQNLRSAEEMEEEERAAQSAKLQELIRRGGPHDLQEANKLMKVMAGYDTRNKTDWRAKAAEEVGKVQQKAKLLEENLQRYKPGDQIKEGDVFEVSHVLKLSSMFTDEARNWQ